MIFSDKQREHAGHRIHYGESRRSRQRLPFELSDWGRQHQATAAATDVSAWLEICAEIAEAGFTAVEVWLAHVDPAHTHADKARQFGEILREHRLEPVGLAGPLDARTAPLMEAMGIGTANAGLFGVTLEQVQATAQQSGLRFNLENHPETSAAAIREKIAGGSEAIGVALDLGWLGTQGVDAVEAIRELGPLVRHVHVKDVAAPGGHVTTPLGEGCVDVRGALRELKRQGYAGWLSWEDEPEDRNPMAIAASMRQWIEQAWSGG